FIFISNMVLLWEFKVYSSRERINLMPERTFKISLRVRYAETDQMGVVYYANYLVWFEVARTELFRELGMYYSEVEKEGIILPAVESHLKYIASAYYDED